MSSQVIGLFPADRPILIGIIGQLLCVSLVFSDGETGRMTYIDRQSVVMEVLQQIQPAELGIIKVFGDLLKPGLTEQ